MGTVRNNGLRKSVIVSGEKERESGGPGNKVKNSKRRMADGNGDEEGKQTLHPMEKGIKGRRVKGCGSQGEW
jgi:hypothetical protein